MPDHENTMNTPLDISFVLPVFRNAGSIKPSYDRICQLAEELALSFEVLFVNDGSDDGSLEQLLQLQRSEKRVRVVSFSRNFGQVAAITAGFHRASGKACLLMSADLQDPIEKAKEMILHWQQGQQVVICYRADREDSWFARFSSGFFYRLIKIGVPNIPEGGFDFLLLDRKALDVYNAIDERNRFFQGDILWLGFKTIFIPYSRQKRTIGKSQWKFSKKLKYFIDGWLNTSYIPIRMMSILGIFTAFWGFLYALVITYMRLYRDVPFSGWAPLMIVILLVGGIIMLMLGIIGEYVWRAYDEIRKRPGYIVDFETPSKEPDPERFTAPGSETRPTG
jgi:glycosyltransferase involved in cell wall biosynthesis